MLGRGIRARVGALVAGGMVLASCHMLSGHADLGPRKAALGQPCSVRDDCQTGQCVDDVCCGNPCEGPCRACNLADHVGTCTPVEAFRDPDADCEEGVCDGSGLCAKGVPGAVSWLEAGRDQGVLDIALGPLDEVIVVGAYVGGIDGIQEAVPPIDGDGEPNQWRLQLSVNGTPEASSAIEAPDTPDFVDDIAAAVLANGTALWGRTRRYPDGERDIWVTSADEAWSLQLGEPGIVERLVSMVAAPDGDLVLMGTFGAKLDLGAAGVLDGGEDAWFVVKVGADAVPRWGRVLRATTSNFGGPGSLQLHAAAAGERIAVVGSFEGSVDASGSLLVAERSAGLVAAFELDGTPAWVLAPTFGEPPEVGAGASSKGTVEATHVALAANGDVIAAFREGASAGARLVRYGGQDAKQVWARGVGPPLSADGSGATEITALAAGADGDLHLGIRLDGDFDVAGRRFEGQTEALILRMSSNGGYLAATELGQGEVNALAVDSHGDLVAGATLFGQVGPAPLEPLVANGNDAVITKLRSDGTALWRRIYGDGGKPIVTTSVASAGAMGSVIGGVVTGELAPQGTPFLGENSGCSVDGFVVRRGAEPEPWQRNFRGCFGGGVGIDEMAVSATAEGWVFALGSTGADTVSRVEYGPPGAPPSEVTVVPPDPPDLAGFLVGIDPIRNEDGHPMDWELRLPMVGTPRLMANGRGGVVAAFERPLRDEDDPYGPIDVRELPHEGGQQRWRYELGLNEACGGGASRCLRDIYAGDAGVALVTWQGVGNSCDPSLVRKSCVTVLAQQGTSARLLWEQELDGLRIDAVALRPDNHAFITGSLIDGPVQLGPDVTVADDAAQVGVMIELRSDGFPLSATQLACHGINRGRMHGTDIEVQGESVIVVGQAAPGSVNGPLLPVPGGPSFPTVDTTFVVKLGLGKQSLPPAREGCPTGGEKAWRALWLRELRGLAQQPARVAVVATDGTILVAGSAQGDLVVDGVTEPTGGEAFLVELEP